jgi:hypothetical protein
MKPPHELTAAMLLNAFNTARLFYAIKNEPEPESLLDDTLEAWKWTVGQLENETNKDGNLAQPMQKEIHHP